MAAAFRCSHNQLEGSPCVAAQREVQAVVAEAAGKGGEGW